MEESTETTQSNLLSHAAKFGAIIGAVSIVLVILIYVISIAFLATFKFLFLLLIIGMGLVIYAGIDYRNEIGGYIPYGKAFLHGLTALAISGIISTVFNILLYTVIDPELPQKLTEAIIANTEVVMRNFGVPEGSIDEALNKMRDEMPKQFTIGGLAYGYVKALVWYACIALITSLFVRKNVPVEL